MSLRTVLTITALLLATAAACSSEPVVVEREIIREVPVEVVREVVVTATPAPQPTQTPHPTATPRPITVPTPTPAPTVTAKRVSEDYYVIIKGKHIEYFADFPSFNNYSAETGGGYIGFGYPDFFLDYLLKEKVITLDQRKAYFRGQGIKVDFDTLSVAIYKFLQQKGLSGITKDIGFHKDALDYLLYHFDESLLESGTEARSRPTPTATPRVSADYYVVIKGTSFEYFVDFPSKNVYASETGGIYQGFSNTRIFLDYLLEENTITPEQRSAYARGGPITVPYDDLSIAIYKLLKSRGRSYMRDQFGIGESVLDRLLYHFDESLLDSDRDSSASAPSDSYVVISDGRLETVVTDADGNTTRVKVGAVDAGEFLDYLLSRGKITVEQRNEYGDTQYLELSLKDAKAAADFFDWAYSSNEGLYIGIDKDDVNYIRDELLPLFSFGD